LVSIRRAAGLGLLCALVGCSLDKAPLDPGGSREPGSGSGGTAGTTVFAGSGGSGGSGGGAAAGGSAGDAGDGGNSGSSGVSGAVDAGSSGTGGAAGSAGTDAAVDGAVPVEPEAPTGELYGPCNKSADCGGDMECTSTGGFCAKPCNESTPCMPPQTGTPMVLCLGECTLQCGPLSVCPNGMACVFPFDSTCKY
jgi:hypothetical protein